MKTILITGVSRGIGKATAEKFLDEGWKVIGTSTSGNIDYKNENLEILKLNLSDANSIENISQAIIKKDVELEALINNAGISLDAWDSGVNMEKVRKTFEVNLFGLIDFTEKMLPLVKEGGSIVNVSSRFGSFSMPIMDDTSIGYCMSKASLNMYTRFLAYRLKFKNICVSSMHPGWAKTDMGYSAATETENPDVEPEQAAEDIYNLAINENLETGQFWYKGEKMDW